MNSFSLISDAIRQLPFALALKENDKVIFMGAHKVGQVWADEMNSKGVSDCCWSIPAGMVRTEYRTFDAKDESLLLKTFNIEGNIEAKDIENLSKHLPLGAQSFLGRHFIPGKDLNPRSVTTQRLNTYNGKTKQNVLEYRARAFTLDVKISSFVGVIKSCGLGFDKETNLFKNRPSNLLLNYSTQQTVKSIGNGVARRFGRKSFVSDVVSPNRRVNRRVESLSIPDVEVKSLNFKEKKHNLMIKNSRFRKW